jgi:hypothetical protein
VVHLHFHKIKTDLFGEKIYFRKLDFYDEGLHSATVGSQYRMKLPSPGLVEAYEKKSREFKSKVRADFARDIERFEKAESSADKPKVNTFEQARLLLADNEKIKQAIVDKGKVTNALVQAVLAEQGTLIGYSSAGAVAKMINLHAKEVVI